MMCFHKGIMANTANQHSCRPLTAHVNDPFGINEHKSQLGGWNGSMFAWLKIFLLLE